MMYLLIVLLLADGITTEIAMRRGYREVGLLPRRLFGETLQLWGNVALFVLYVVGILVIHFNTPRSFSVYFFAGGSAVSAWVLYRNIRLLRK